MNNRYGRIVTATKSIDLPQWPTESWTWFGGKPVEPGSDLATRVAFTYRAMSMIAQCLADIPFAIVQGETDVDTSDDWQNKLGFLPDPKRLLQQTARGLMRHGKAYHLRDRIGEGSKAVKQLRWLAPTSVTEVIDPLLGLTKFTRPVGGVSKEFAPIKDIIYFWLPDEDVEIGPPLSYPAKATLAAAGVLNSVDNFASGYFENGAIKATILPVPPNMPVAEQEKLEKKLHKLITGVRNAFKLYVLGIGADNRPIVIGEGLEALKDAGAITRAREDVTAGFGISIAMILSSEANYATAVEDRKTLYSNTVLPMANFIAETWNQQLFRDLGYKFVFRHEGMEIFQEDEASRATSLGSLVTALDNPEVAKLGMSILGYDLTLEQTAELDKLIASKTEARERMAEMTSQPGTPVEEKPNEEKPVDEYEAKPSAIENTAKSEELARYKRKATRALKGGKSPDVDFESLYIPVAVMTSIKAKLATAKTEDEVKAAFVFTPPDKADPSAAEVLEGIRLGVQVWNERYKNE